MSLSSPDFVKRLKDHDHDAIELLVISYNEALFKGALKMGLAADQAEEVVQATWSTFFTNVDNFKGESHVRSYLFGIMYNKTKETWRCNKKYTEDFKEYAIEALFSERGGFIQSPKDPSDWVNSTQVTGIIRDCLERLPENQRLAFNLKEIQGESTEEICKIMGITSTYLGVLIYRAKNNLRLHLEKQLSKGDDL